MHLRHRPPVGCRETGGPASLRCKRPDAAVKPRRRCVFLVSAFLSNPVQHGKVCEMEDENEQRLQAIAQFGIFVNGEGDLRDNLGYPTGRRGLPANTPPARQRISYSHDDDVFLKDWVSKAETQGLAVKPKIFDDLESIVGRNFRMNNLP